MWARETGIPLSLPDAARVLLYGVRRRVDLGRAGNRYFLMMAGIGFDAEVTRRVEKSLLKRMGLKLLDYVTTVGVLGATHKAVRVRLKRDGKGRDISALMLSSAIPGSTVARSRSHVTPSRMMACWMSL